LSGHSYIKASVEATLIVVKQPIFKSQNSNNNYGLAFYNAGQFYKPDCVGNNLIIKTTMHAM